LQAHEGYRQWVLLPASTVRGYNKKMPTCFKAGISHSLIVKVNYLFPLPPPEALPVVDGAFTKPDDFAIL